MKHYFCTLFDSNYLLKGVAMLRSLSYYCPGTRIFVLCMDEQTREILTRLDMPFVTCISLDEIEDESLLKVKPERNTAEYCWTLSPSLPWYLMQNHLQIDCITYVDADLLFYAPVQPLFDEIGDASIAIIEHRFPPKLKHMEIAGRFCVEWVSFRRDAEGIACLQRWREQCIEWCFDRVEAGRMGDQKYLDEWPMRYSGCHILQHAGAGIAPWNYSQYRFGLDEDQAITINETPLIFYHFHQFQLLNDGTFYRLSHFYTNECREPEFVYAAYEEALQTVLQEVRQLVPDFSAGLRPPPKQQFFLRRLIAQCLPLGAKRFLLGLWIR